MTGPNHTIPPAIERDLLICVLDQDALIEAAENVCAGHGMEKDVMLGYMMALATAGLLSIYTYGGLQDDEIIPLPASALPGSFAHLGHEVFLSPTDDTLSRLNAIS